MTASVLSIGPAQAGEEYHSPSDNVDTGSSVALFEGKAIDLAEGWGEAQACMVWRAAGAVECFRSSAELVEREAEIKAEAGFGAQSLMMACGDPLKLFEHTNYGGRELWFYDQGYWQNLSAWSFGDELSSYQVGGCDVHLAEHTGGGGYWYPGNTSAYHWESAMSAGGTSWNDRVSSFYIN